MAPSFALVRYTHEHSGQHDHSCSRCWRLVQPSVVGEVSVTHSAAVPELSVLHTGVVVVGVPNVGAATVDGVDSCCVERRPSGILD
jgi:hypothetical protein